MMGIYWDDVFTGDAEGDDGGGGGGRSYSVQAC